MQKLTWLLLSSVSSGSAKERWEECRSGVRGGTVPVKGKTEGPKQSRTGQAKTVSSHNAQWGRGRTAINTDNTVLYQLSVHWCRMPETSTDDTHNRYQSEIKAQTQARQCNESWVNPLNFYFAFGAFDGAVFSSKLLKCSEDIHLGFLCFHTFINTIPTKAMPCTKFNC